MRLKCPVCKARFDVPDALVPASWAQLECPQCAASFTALSSGLTVLSGGGASASETTPSGGVSGAAVTHVPSAEGNGGAVSPFLSVFTGRDSNGVERPSDAAEVNADGVWQETVAAKGVRFELIWVPPGELWMGSRDGEEGSRDDERPRHRVRLTRGFWLGKTPVTQGQWTAVMGTNPSDFTNVGLDGPVEQVSWEDCQELVQALRRAAGCGWRLTTEAEWEYACRAGAETAWCFGGEEGKLAQYGWYDANAGYTTHPVGRLKSNAWGIYDMHGNVWEWVQDWNGAYSAGDKTDPSGPSSGSFRCYRGGSWLESACCCRSAYRCSFVPGIRFNVLGVRLARVQP
jgi:predicted Zn finger-like uncharacterized protein